MTSPSYLGCTVILCALISIFSGCKDPNETGIGVLPDSDQLLVRYSDTVTVECETIIVDSVLTDESTLSLFGSYLDPQFGRISTATYTQFRTTGNNLNFGDSLSFDSLILSLDLIGFYGKVDDPQVLNVFEIDSAGPGIVRGNDYYSNDSVAVRTVELSSRYPIAFTGSSSSEADLRVPLDSTLGKKLLFADPSASLVNNTEFEKMFRGLYITTEAVTSGTGAIFQANLLTANTKLILYYTGKINGTFVDTSYSFVINSDAARFHSIKRSEYADKMLGQAIANPSTDGRQNIFIQSGAVVKVMVKFPYIANLSPLGVNKADLVFTADESLMGTNNMFSVPTPLLCFEADSVNGPTTDFAFTIADYSNKEYVLPLKNYIQRLIAGQEANATLVLLPPSIRTTVNRVVLGGPAHPLMKPKLRLTYTVLPE